MPDMPDVVGEARIRRTKVECAIVDHCNLACSGCDKASPHLAPAHYAVSAFERDARALARALHADRLRLVGGEPLLHPELPALLVAARNSGLANEIQLWTNGVNLHEADPRIFGLIDQLRVTVYPNVRLRFDVNQVRALASQHGFRLYIEESSDFMHALLNRRNEDADLVRDIFAECKNAHEWSCHSFQAGKYYKCSRAHYLQSRLLNCPDDRPSTDGIDLHGPYDLRTELARYLEDDKPLRACEWCLGTSGKQFPHRQLTRKGRALELANTAEPRTLLRSD